MKTLMILLMAAGTWGYATAQNTQSTTTTHSTHSQAQGDTSVAGFIKKAMKSSAHEIEAGKLAQQKAQSATVKAYGARMVKDHSDAIALLKPIASKKNLTLAPMTEAGGAAQTGTGQATATGTQQANANTGTSAERNPAASTNTRANTNTTNTNTSANTNTSNTNTTANTNTSGTNTSANTNTSNNTTGTTTINQDGSGKAWADTTKKGDHQAKMQTLNQATGADFDRQYMRMMVDDHMKAVSLFERAATSTDLDVKNFATNTLPVLRDHLQSAQTILSSLK